MEITSNNARRSIQDFTPKLYNIYSFPMISRSVIRLCRSRQLLRATSAQHNSYVNSFNCTTTFKGSSHSYSRVRYFSSSNSSNSSKEEDTILAKIMSPENQAYATIAGGTIGTLLFAKVSVVSRYPRRSPRKSIELPVEPSQCIVSHTFHTQSLAHFSRLTSPSQNRCFLRA